MSSYFKVSKLRPRKDSERVDSIKINNLRVTPAAQRARKNLDLL